jgi:copper chaperone NosL
MIRMAFVIAVLAAGCSDQEMDGGPVRPVTMSEDAVGHYCQMNVLDHSGPKAQLHLAGNEHPLWFVQIRDAFAYDRMPEQTERVTAIFVSDMGAPDAAWEQPGADNWIRAQDAYYVIDSRKRGGMGASEFIPFAQKSEAEQFAMLEGGRVIPYAEITDEAVLAPEEVEIPQDLPSGGS